MPISTLLQVWLRKGNFSFARGSRAIPKAYVGAEHGQVPPVLCLWGPREGPTICPSFKLEHLVVSSLLI